ncbi:hypothetical protein MIZ03_3005 [Rhodoferax lithotrophicus]|uniref:Phosphoglycerate mutase n=1 Tax=Rhodoferax lithotrophicus TaxID=2798804 RepID=A0ABM7MP54_9BURK|nr:phosphoglycerate mutase [Rhodoferax sp. MIZ03]BCO28109.1 hypothetical protein MIZ03_3005 [Rhodoferax sp. MIZ03]
MHLLIPFAASHDENCLAILPSLNLPHLQKLLSRLTAQPLDAGDELSLSPPHERALARPLGLPVQDGQIPWAAWQAQKRPDLVPVHGGAWALVTLCNWQASAHQVTMSQIPMKDLNAAESDQFLSTMQPFFNEDGITLYPLEPGHWLAHGAVFAQLRSASPDRVLGRNLEPWMPQSTQANSLIRLMSEMQMLLYNHPTNTLREQRGALPVNAFWLSGTGEWPAPLRTTQALEPTVIPHLRDAALLENWRGWREAWHALDAREGLTLLQASARGEAVQLTLCGERHAQTWHSQPLTLRQKIKSFFGPQRIQDLLKQL